MTPSGTCAAAAPRRPGRFIHRLRSTGEDAYCFLLSFALGLRLLYPHLRHLVAFFGLVAEQFMQTVLSRSLLSASLKRAMVFTSWRPRC